MNQGRFTKVHVRGYRTLADCTFEPSAGVTMVIGPNATGKTSLLDALALIADILRGDVDPFSGDARGSIGNLNMPLTTMITSRSRPSRLVIAVEFVTNDITYRYSVTLVPVGDDFNVGNETLVIPGSDDAKMLISRGSRDAWIRQGDYAVMVQVGVSAKGLVLALASDGISYPQVNAAWRFLRGVCILRLTPMMMRAERPPGTIGLIPDRYGRDLALRLRDMASIDFTSVWTNWMNWMDSFVGHATLRPFRLSLASDGFVVHAYLAILACNPPPDVSVYLVDDPGLPNYPEDMHALGGLIGAISVGGRQVIAVSHSPSVVEALADITSVWRIDREANGTARLARLPEDDEDLADDIAVRGIGVAAFAARTMATERSEP